MTRSEESKAFNRGYMCALACLVNGHGLSREVEDALGCNNMTIAQMRRSGVDESDIEALRPAIKELERKRKLFNSTP